ncbi:MAG: tRNA uridine(34) 5-carboxymethylaminomethyl modification radical SAM/GNAT enzyme Elp3 [Candidatus Aenigmatarchaeota archaeon]
MEFEHAFLRETVEKLLDTPNLSRKKAELVTKSVAKKYNLAFLPTNVQLLQACNEEEKSQLKQSLLRKPIRSISGVNIITIATAPADSCAWGKCIYCLKGPNSPQSYVGTEPVIQRAMRRDYDPFLQVSDRLRQYDLMGHGQFGNKIEMIILGGTFLGLKNEYKEWFIKRMFDALNNSDSENLEQAQLLNETATNRCVNLTLETRPDFSKEIHVDEMLRFGTTRVEIGVQSIYDDVIKFVNRGHTVQDVIDATRIVRNAALKINYHIMPGLPLSDFDKDLEMFKELFSNPNFKPDYLKIYPTVVAKGTKLYELWKNGEFKPYSSDELIELVARSKKFIPKYCRIQHIGRLIPTNEVEAGCKNTNIRQLIQKKAGQLGIKCNCIRCREIGFKIQDGIYPEKIEMTRTDYETAGGKEAFFAFEDLKNDIICGFLRLRFPDSSHRKEIDSDTALVRELKVMGNTVPIGLEPGKIQWQHRGFGKQLMNEAERISKEEFGKKKIIVMSAIGTREYYRKLGYEKDGVYVSKVLN